MEKGETDGRADHSRIQEQERIEPVIDSRVDERILVARKVEGGSPSQAFAGPHAQVPLAVVQRCGQTTEQSRAENAVDGEGQQVGEGLAGGMNLSGDTVNRQLSQFQRVDYSVLDPSSGTRGKIYGLRPQ